MKKLILTTIFTLAAGLCCIGSYAQPRSVGLRIGAGGLEADYAHTFSGNQFLEGNLGMDFGYNAIGIPGIKATATYNFVWARPAWTHRGSWAIYAGPGASIGYVNDEVHYKDGMEVRHYLGGGFMLGICGQVGLEYTFWFPLQLSVDLRPCIGLHINERVGFYDNGLLGFVPSVSVRYRF